MPGSPTLDVTLLGTGTSTGVPVLGCDCPVCTSPDPKDTRLRCAAYVRAGSLGLLIDTGPDFRQQALTYGVHRLDAVCYTHHHFDHIAGLDDLRPYFFQNRTPMPCYGPPQTVEILREKYDYVFGSAPYPGAARVYLEAVADAFCVDSRHEDGAAVQVTPVPLLHGSLPVYGYRVGRFAYLTDVSTIPEDSFALLEGLDVLVLDALRPKAHPTHLSFDEAVATAERIGATQTFFVHMTHNVRHAEQNARLPAGIALGYDGLTFTIDA
ncbi:MBL fold metallo-hydrolase [Salisaeta longa]|uniref:MBL fold metallo-hydrolase n=1 Tax=Salisaeta longa TaxID=503170 RepID=UPI0003B40EEF|nr:MBL fold metallo-hydrolase [Salisaeta longa]